MLIQRVLFAIDFAQFPFEVFGLHWSRSIDRKSGSSESNAEHGSRSLQSRQDRTLPLPWMDLVKPLHWPETVCLMYNETNICATLKCGCQNKRKITWESFEKESVNINYYFDSGFQNPKNSTLEELKWFQTRKKTKIIFFNNMKEFLIYLSYIFLYFIGIPTIISIMLSLERAETDGE